MKITDRIKTLKKEQIGFIVIAIFLFAFGIYSIAKTDAIISKGVTVVATVTDIDMESDWLLENDHDGKNDYDIVYEYNGKEYRNRILKSEMRAFNSTVSGDTIHVYIDPENPHRIAVRSDKFGYICIFGAIVALAISYIIGYKKEARYKNYD